MARPFSRTARYQSLNPNKSSGNALTASGFKMNAGDADTMRRIAQPWQRRSFAYYNIVPEIKYAAQFYSRALSVLRLYAGELQDDGTIEETTDPDAIEMLNRVQDPGGGGRENLLATYGRLMFLTGEGYLVATKNKEIEDLEQWEMLSMVELRPEGSGYVRYRAPSLQPEMFKEPSDDDYEPITDDEAVVYRLWRPHPEFSMLADATMQGVLEICEELVLLTQAVRARAKSRLAGSGILIVNGKVIPAPAEAVPGEDPSEDIFMRDLIDAMTSPITNEGSASSVVPHVVRVDPGTEGLDDVMKHIQIIDPMQTYPETGLRYELIKRLAIGLDMPAEILLGLSDTNHWNAWQVDEQTWKGHLQPVANQLVADLTTSFFQPSLRQAGKENWNRFVVAYDATAVINHPDRGKDAKDLYDDGELSGVAYREAKGFTEDDAPTQEERWRYLGIKIRDGSLALYGEPSIRSGGVEPAPGEIVDSTGTHGEPTGPTVASDVEKGPPAATPAENVIGSAARDAQIARILGASDVAFIRTRELAGARVRNYAKKDPASAKLIDGVTSSKVAAAIGVERARELKVPAARALVAGGAELLLETLRTWGVEAAFAKPLGDRLEQHAAATLFDERPAPLPRSFENYVTGLSANGDGRAHGANGAS